MMREMTLTAAAVAMILLVPQTVRAQNLSAPGRIEAAGGTIAIGSAATGTIKEMLVREWSRVHAGDLLVSVDCQPLEAEVDARTAQLSAATAVYDRVRNGPRRAEITVGEAAVGYSRARAEEAQKSLQRTLALHEGVSVTTARILEVQRDARITAAYLVEAEAKLALLREGSREEDVREALARKDNAAGELELAQARLDQCSIRAPSNGVITDVLATPGQFLSLSVPTILLHMVVEGPLWVRIEIDPRDLSRVCIDQSATVTTEAFPNVSLRAKVEAMSPALSPRTTPGVESRSKEIGAIVLSFEGRVPRVPIGLPVTAHLDPCPSKS